MGQLDGAYWGVYKLRLIMNVWHILVINPQLKEKRIPPESQPDFAQPLLLPLHWAFSSSGPDSPLKLGCCSLGGHTNNGALKSILPAGDTWMVKWSYSSNVTSISVVLEITKYLHTHYQI